MVAFLSILLAVILLGATVYGLHRYQTMEVEYTVDRSMPLPPLEDEDSIAAIDQQSQSPTASPAPDSEQSATKPTAKSKTSQTWLGEVGQLKKSGELDQAMSICEKEFPLWGAYNQACIIERLRLKKARDSEQRDQVLQRLYRLAATAELLHDKSEGAEHLTPAQLKSLQLEQLTALEFAYPEIGYAHLRLIRKSDVKEMQTAWGRPEQHQLPRQIHREWWQGFTSGVA